MLVRMLCRPKERGAASGIDGKHGDEPILRYSSSRSEVGSGCNHCDDNMLAEKLTCDPILEGLTIAIGFGEVRVKRILNKDATSGSLKS